MQRGGGDTERRGEPVHVVVGQQHVLLPDVQQRIHAFRLPVLQCKRRKPHQHGRVQPQPMHDHGAYERRLGRMPVEPGERELVHPFVQHGVRPNGRRDVLVFAWSLIRHSDVHGYAEVRTLQQTDPLARRARVGAERLHALER